MREPSAAGWISTLLNASPAEDGNNREAILERALNRERKARQKSELLLETRSRELYLANERLIQKNAQIERRNQTIENSNAALISTQAQLVQSEKMASVGQLAAGVAHEINNPIGFITSNLSTLQNYTDVMSTLIERYQQVINSVNSTQPTASILDEIRRLQEKEDIDFILGDVGELVSESIDGAKRVKDIVLGLKDFSRVDNADITDADLHSGIESTLKVLSNEVKYNCDVVLEFGDLPLIPCNLARINQVLLNLVVNASQSIEGQGTITISTFVEEDWAFLTVRDTGSGISQEHIDSIFDPFYTTKPVGSGTGLGLSISYGIIEEHGGKLTVNSKVGEGSVFTIQLPLQAGGRLPEPNEED